MSGRNAENASGMTRRDFLMGGTAVVGSLLIPSLLGAENARANELLQPGIAYGFAVGNIPVRSDITTRARTVMYYAQNSLVRYESAQGNWARVVQDSDRQKNGGRLFIPLDYINPLSEEDIMPFPVLGSDDTREIDVNLTKLRMQAIQNGYVVNEVPISTGKPGHETPTGIFPILDKRWAREMVGPGYDLPGVPLAERLNDNGVFIHGAWWHAAFGRQNVSHGCINARIPDALWFYRFTQPAHANFNVAIQDGGDNPTIVKVHYENQKL